MTIAPVDAGTTVPDALREPAPTVTDHRPGRVLPTVAGMVVAGWIVAAVAWPWLAPDDPSAQDADDVFAPPSTDHLFGADSYGRDVLSRVLAGAREVLVIAPLAVALAVAVGTVVGLAIGYRGGFSDSVAMRTLEAIAVLPPLFPVILAAALLGHADLVLIVVIAFAFTPLVTWTVRSATLVEREKQYVEAARLRGERGTWIATREILPNITAPITVEATVRLADAIFAIATLSFVGLGAPPGSPDWGAQVAENRVYVQNAWWTVLFPALAVASLVVAVSLLADAIRERRR